MWYHVLAGDHAVACLLRQAREEVTVDFCGLRVLVRRLRNNQVKAILRRLVSGLRNRFGDSLVVSDAHILDATTYDPYVWR